MSFFHESLVLAPRLWSPHGRTLSELELIPVEQRENQFIKFPIKLEQYLMEGTYRHIEEAQKQVPAASYSYFVTKLSGTVRDSIADRLVSLSTTSK